MPTRSQLVVVEDDNEMGLLLRDFFTRQGYSVLTAHSGPVALKLIHALPKNRPADLVLSDVLLGAMSGIELTKRLHEECPDLPVVLFSGFGNGNLEKEARESGARDYLKKPFQLSEIARIVRDQLKK